MSAACLLFAAVGAVAWKIGLMMGAAQFHWRAHRRRPRHEEGRGLIKPLLVVTCIALAVRLLWEPDHPLAAPVGF
jgi:uncharacterized protein